MGEKERKESRVNSMLTDVPQTHNVERMILMKGKGRISVAFVEAVGEVTGGRRKLCVCLAVWNVLTFGSLFNLVYERDRKGRNFERPMDQGKEFGERVK